MTAHFSQNISFLTPWKFLISSLKNSDDHFSCRPHIIIILFPVLFPNFPQKVPYFSLHFSFSSLKNSDDLILVFNTKYTSTFLRVPPLHPRSITAKTPFHHCTFWASLHVKTCPGAHNAETGSKSDSSGIHANFKETRIWIDDGQRMPNP